MIRGYFPLVWMNHSRLLNNRINSLHERELRLVHRDFVSSFSELLEKDNSVTIHQRNLQCLVYEIFKAQHSLSPEIMSEIFKFKDTQYNLRNNMRLQGRNVKTVSYGNESVSALAPKLWRLLPPEIKNIESPSEFKQKIKTFKIENCPCRLCKVYIKDIGFI